MQSTELKSLIQEKYGAAARQAASKSQVTGCCGGACGTSGGAVAPDHNSITGGLYSDAELASIPDAAAAASLGCGNPTALIDLKSGEVVLDLGSGGGIDVLLTARRVGTTGKVYGLDMTDDMLALARANQHKAGVHNVEFLKGEIENVPLPDGAVDVIISNCVINLSADKDLVLREAFRVLKPGGRFAVSDVVSRGAVPDAIRRDVDAWTGCVAGALDVDDYRQKLTAAGFVDIDIDAWRSYDFAGGAFASAFIRARKPQ